MDTEAKRKTPSCNPNPDILPAFTSLAVPAYTQEIHKENYYTKVETQI
jgi:hypothetical protein